jgi:hypothetical protein
MRNVFIAACLLHHCADHDVKLARQIITDVHDMNDTSDLVPSLQATLTDLAIQAVQ